MTLQMHHHILGQVLLSPAPPLSFGVQIPPFFRVHASKFNPLLQKNPAYISSNVFHFPLRRRPWSPNPFSAIKLFHTFHLLVSSLPKTFLSFKFFTHTHPPPVK